MLKSKKPTVMVGVLRYGQSALSKPAFYITLQEADYWFAIGAIEQSEPTGERMKKRGVPLMRLSKPTSDRLQLRSTTGPALTWACLMAVLHGQTAQTNESLSLAASFKPENMPVSVLLGWNTPDVVYAS